MPVKAMRIHPLLFSVALTLVIAAGLLAAPQPAQAQQGDCVVGNVLTICLDLQPEEATNPVGTSHTVTATLTQSQSGLGGPFVPFPGQTISFEITEGPDAGVTGSCVTDANGQCTFTFTNNGRPGTDTIVGSAFAGTRSAVSDEVTKTFVEASPQGAPQQGAQQPPGAATGGGGGGGVPVTQEVAQDSQSGTVDISHNVSNEPG